MHQCAGFEVIGDQANVFLHSQIIIRKFVDVKTIRTILGNQICCAVIVNELADVAAFVAERTETFQKFVIAIHSIANRNTDPRHFIVVAFARH